MAWVFATVGQLDAVLFASLTNAAEHRVGDLRPQELANMAWALVTVGKADAQLFRALASVAQSQVGEFKP